MDYNGGSRGRDPFDPYDEDRGNDAYAGSTGNRGDGASDRQGYGQSPYSRSPYEQSPYNGGSYGDYGDYGSDRGGSTGRIPRADYDRGNTGRMQRPDYNRDDPYARVDSGARDYDRAYDRDDGYGRTDRTTGERDDYRRDDRGGYDRGDSYGRDDRGGYDRGDDYTRADSYGRVDRGDDYTRADSYGRADRSDDYTRDDGYGRADRGDDYTRADGYGRADRGDDYTRADGYGRADRGARGDYGEYGRDDREADAFSATGRKRMPRGEFDPTDAPEETAFEDSYDEEEVVRTPKKKKKRSKFSRFMRGLGAYIAQLPTQTLVIFGGIVAVVLVGIILLVVLLPKAEKSTQTEDNGQLSIADITPTPSLPPTAPPPEVTPAPEVTPIVDPFNGTYIKTIGEENDVIPAVQERLVELGYMDMPAEGYTKRYGTATKNGIRIFQVKNYEDSKDWDGILGLGTYSLLMSEEAQPFYLARGDGDSRTADLTQLVNAVKKLQTKLIELGYLGAGSDTGVFGSGTATAVKTFQQYHGLLADGWAGQSTLTMLYSPQAMTAAVGKESPYTPTPALDAAGGATTAADPNAAAGTTADPNAAGGAAVDSNAAAATTPDPNAAGTVVES